MTINSTKPDGSEPVAGPVDQPVRPLPAPHYPQWSHSNEYAAWTERQVRAIVAQEVAAERERWMAAVSWALGTNGYFREQGTMEGKYWWRGELAERAGLRWDGSQWVDAGPNVAGNRPPSGGPG